MVEASYQVTGGLQSLGFFDFGGVGRARIMVDNVAAIAGQIVHQFDKAFFLILLCNLPFLRDINYGYKLDTTNVVWVYLHIKGAMFFNT
jgi:hypothetical protein